MHGNAKQTGGGLKKKDLKYNKQGKIVSKKMSTMAKKEKRLQKAGYTTKKGQFGAVRTMRGGDNFYTYYYFNNYKYKYTAPGGWSEWNSNPRDMGLILIFNKRDMSKSWLSMYNYGMLIHQWGRITTDTKHATTSSFRKKIQKQIQGQLTPHRFNIEVSHILSSVKIDLDKGTRTSYPTKDPVRWELKCDPDNIFKATSDKLIKLYTPFTERPKNDTLNWVKISLDQIVKDTTNATVIGANPVLVGSLEETVEHDNSMDQHFFGL
jgi:hypothetical protein